MVECLALFVVLVPLVSWCIASAGFKVSLLFVTVLFNVARLSTIPAVYTFWGV